MPQVAPVPQVKSLSCPNCGSTVDLRADAQAVNAVCGSCGSILDATTPTLTILQAFHLKEKVQPLIPLGARGKLHDILYQHIGFQVRAIVVDGVTYRWTEYLLYNPYHGYRYLSEYNYHWNDIKTIQSLPAVFKQLPKPIATVGGKKYTHYQTAVSRTAYVMGEFPWQVRIGEEVTGSDYLNAPYLLSSEETKDEVVWSLGQYTAGKDIWDAFKLPGVPPKPVGVFANQENPYGGSILSAWKTYFLLTLLTIGVMFGLSLLSHSQKVFEQSYSFGGPGKTEAFVTPSFDIGSKSNVQVKVKTNLDNAWAAFTFSLINEATGITYDFGKEVSYYHGSDSDGSWSEGGKSASTTIPAVPPGRYYLRVEPEMEESAQRMLNLTMMRYNIEVDTGGGNKIWFVPVFFLLLIPPIFSTYRVMQFENARWADSDYGNPIGGSSSGGDDD